MDSCAFAFLGVMTLCFGMWTHHVGVQKGRQQVLDEQAGRRPGPLDHPLDP